MNTFVKPKKIVFEKIDLKEEKRTDEDNIEEPDLSMMKIPIISSIGLSPAFSLFDPTTFKFYMGHTNFKVTPEIFKIVDNTDGIEALDIVSPYRFRIAVGKLFDDESVMRNVNQAINKHLNDKA